MKHEPIQIDIQNLQKSFAQKEILHDISITFKKGEFIAVIGKSGSGKSTLLRLVASLEEITQGELLFDGVPAKHSDANVKMMYQDSRLLPWKKVIDNVGLGLTGNWPALAEEALDKVGLLQLKDEWPSTLSGGQKQRVALARALIHEPSLLMLDEPLSALDALTRIEMQNLIETIWQKNHFTALLVTHDVSEAVRLADRIILIEDGSIAFDKTILVPRPRKLTNPLLIELEEKILNRLMNGREIANINKEQLPVSPLNLLVNP
ncbi:ATP-binding cassette domain-containing protein [Solibacillus sp. R5-41]|uniref:ATP-binding cassette domain-containing protein n=1 Tax=Solibacillus sp. R5-41 TaxID=2048654 RepID=UPI0020A524AF|nr:ATP-binding cassette domain-containing protein [Solibacillus sp. R5-41]